MLGYILASTILISLVSLAGVILLVFGKKTDSILFVLIAFAAGSMIGASFFNLLPESLEKLSVAYSSMLLIFGFALFFLIEKFLFWRHCHDEECKVHNFTYLNLIGDGLHNFLDGILVAASYLAGISVGISVTLSVIFHEIPQEIGDFAVLIYGGFSKVEALLFNLLSASLAILGALIGYYFLADFSYLLVPVAAGSFLYIAASDLIPELHKEKDLWKSMLAFFFFVLGVCVIFALSLIGI